MSDLVGCLRNTRVKGSVRIIELEGIVNF